MDELLLAWFSEKGADLPGGRRAIPTRSSSREVMLQQTQVERVIPRYRPLARALADRGGVGGRFSGGGNPRVAGARLQPASGQPAPRGAADRRAGLARRPDRAARRGRVYRGGDPQLRLRSAGASASIRTCAAFRSARAVHVRARSVRRPCSTSARPSVWLASRGAGSAPRGRLAPRAERRYEPLRKQSRFEGSFRQRRARRCRAVAAARARLAELDAEAVSRTRAGRPRRGTANGTVRLPA